MIGLYSAPHMMPGLDSLSQNLHLFSFIRIDRQVVSDIYVKYRRRLCIYVCMYCVFVVCLCTCVCVCVCTHACCCAHTCVECLLVCEPPSCVVCTCDLIAS